MISIEGRRQGALLDIAIELNGAVALDEPACAALAGALASVARDADVYAAVLRVTGGGAAPAPSGPQDFVTLLAAHRLAWQIDCFPKPLVSYLTGAVPAALSALALRGTHRVAGPDYRFRACEAGAMDVPPLGLAHALAGMPDAVGLYLALSGDEVMAGDAHALGIVTHALHAADFAAVVEGLAAADPVDPLLDRRTCTPPEAALTGLRPTLRRCLDGRAPDAILDCLEAAAATKDLARRARRRSALGRALAHGVVSRARGCDLRTCILADYALACRLVATGEAASGDASAAAALLDAQAPLPPGAPELSLPTRRELQKYKD